MKPRHLQVEKTTSWSCYQGSLNVSRDISPTSSNYLNSHLGGQTADYLTHGLWQDVVPNLKWANCHQPMLQRRRSEHHVICLLPRSPCPPRASHLPSGNGSSRPYKLGSRMRDALFGGQQHDDSINGRARSTLILVLRQHTCTQMPTVH